MASHSPRQQFKEARQIASDHNLVLVDKGSEFLLYRKTAMRLVFLGRRSSAQAIRTLVCNCAKFK